MQRLPAVFLITFVFGILYSMLDRMSSKNFGFKSILDPFYFSFTTMSSVGYGDFVPKTNTAKMLVMIQQGIIIGEVISLLGLEANASLSNRMAQMTAMMPPMKTA
jgi:hypothetical protein